jgi:hypothetical protein
MIARDLLGCSGFVGLGAVFKHFSGLEFFLIFGVNLVPPTNHYRLPQLSRAREGFPATNFFENFHGCESSRFFIFRRCVLFLENASPPPSASVFLTGFGLRFYSTAVWESPR